VVGREAVRRPAEALYESALRYERHFERGESWRLWAAAARVRLWAARLRGPAFLAAVHSELGLQHQRRGRLDAARAHYRASLGLRRRLGDARGVAWMEALLADLGQPRRRPTRIAAPAVEPATPVEPTAEPEAAPQAAPEPEPGPEPAAAWDVTELGFDDEWLVTSAAEMGRRLERLGEPAPPGTDLGRW
jgi:hypothetical protein